MDVQSLRRVLHDFFRFNPKDFFVQASATGFLVSIVRTSGGGNTNSLPFQVYNGKNKDTTQSSAGYVKVSLNSNLLNTADPTDDIDIEAVATDPETNGLDESFKLVNKDRVWLKLDLSGLYKQPPTAILANIGHGQTWQPAGKTFYPTPVEYDTADGNLVSDSPPNTKQIAAYVHLGYVDSSATDIEGLIDAGFGLVIGPDPDNKGESLYFLQKCFSHLIVGSVCIDGNTATLALPSPYGSMPDNSEP